MRRRLTIELKQGRAGWFLRLLSANGKIRLVSEAYAKRGNAVRAARKLQADLATMSGVDIMDRDPEIGCWRKLA